MNRFITTTAIAIVCLIAADVSSSAAAHRDEAVYRAAEAHRASALDLLKTIVNIDSGSGDIAGGQRIEEAFRAP